jgi:Fe-S cluster assembly protein SufD
MSDSPLYQASLTRLAEQHGQLHGLRAEAAAWFASHGLPGAKDEAWRFTPLGALTALPYARAEIEQPRCGGSAIVLGNGRSLASDLTAAPPDGVELSSLVEALTPLSADSAFSALNTALFEHGLTIRVRAGVAVDRPIEIVVASAAHHGPSVDLPRILVVAEPNAELHLIETHVGTGEHPFLSNQVVQVHLGEGARMEHTRVEHGTELGRRIGLTEVRQARDSRYASRVVTLGGALSRLELRVLLQGEGAECDLRGGHLARGAEHLEHHTVIDHQAACCRSHESYRGIVQDQAHVVFDGTIVIRRGAQRSSAHQENRNLLLSEQAKVNSKPHLEIDADDVKCSHGASVGQLDPEALFYLGSRGIEPARARALLTFAFVRQELDATSFAPLRASLRSLVQARLFPDSEAWV